MQSPAATGASKDACRLEPVFLEGGNGLRFGLWTLPDDEPPRATVLFVHGFGEELNKSRRMVAMQARQLAGLGIACLALDLGGCGDSPQDSGAVGWADWLADVRNARDHIQQRFGTFPWIWGLRSGVLLALAALQQQPPSHVLMWQPMPDGAAQVNGLYRLLQARYMTDVQRGQAVLEAAKASIARGDAIEIAGYRIPADVMAGWSGVKLDPLIGPDTRHAALFEVRDQPAGGDGPSLSPAMQRLQQTLAAKVADFEATPINGRPFWTTTEIEDCPDLIRATTALCQRWLAQAGDPHA